MKLYKKTAHELCEMLRAKKVSAAEISRDVMEAISEKEPVLHSYITVSGDIEKQAEKVDKAIAAGQKLHPLAGIPVAVKDNISVKGVKMTCGSKMLENYIPSYNASAVEKLYSAGMIITGKTNMDEFAMGASTETSYFGRTCNPYAEEYTAGGSSGGSAAAVSAGEAILALGSDTGGSIRQPAAFCGITGLKPTYGSVSRYGLTAFASSLEQIGPMGKDTADTAMLYSLICGRDKKDATSVIRDYSDFMASPEANIKGQRIGIPVEYYGENIDTEVKNAVLEAVKLLEKMGAEIKEVTLPLTSYVVNTYYIISSAEASSNLARYDGVRYGYRTKNFTSLTDMYTNTRSEGFGREVKKRIMLGTYVLSSGYYDAYYSKAQQTRSMITKEVNDVFGECDMLITPSYPTAAFKTGTQADSSLSMYTSDICTVTANITGIPALSVPCGYTKDGLPIGMQIMGRHFSEQQLFNTAYVFEKITDRVYTGGAVK